MKKREAQYLASAQSPSTHDSDWQSEFIEHFWPAHTGSRDAQGGRPTPAALAIAECPGRQGCGSRTRGSCAGSLTIAAGEAASREATAVDVRLQAVLDIVNARRAESTPPGKAPVMRRRSPRPSVL